MSDMLQQNNDQRIFVPISKDGLPINTADLNSATYKLYSLNKKVVKLTKELADGITRLDDTLTISISKEDCKYLVGVFYHELTVVDSSNNTSTVFKKDITFQPTCN